MDRNRHEAYHNEKDKEVAHQTLPLAWSDSIALISEEEMLHTPFTVTWLLKSTFPLSTNKAAMCFSSPDRDSDFSIDSHGQILITPPSAPDHRSPAQPENSIFIESWTQLYEISFCHCNNSNFNQNVSKFCQFFH